MRSPCIVFPLTCSVHELEELKFSFYFLVLLLLVCLSVTCCMEVCIFLFVVVFNGVKQMPLPPPTTMPGHTHAKYNALHTHAKFIDFSKVYKSCKAVIGCQLNLSGQIFPSKEDKGLQKVQKTCL